MPHRLKVRQFDTKEDVVEASYGANPVDEGFCEVLADYSDDPVYDELKSLSTAWTWTSSANWLRLCGSDEETLRLADWAEAIRLARQAYNDRTSDYLLGTPLLADYLGEGLSQFDLSCGEMEKAHL